MIQLTFFTVIILSAFSIVEAKLIRRKAVTYRTDFHYDIINSHLEEELSGGLMEKVCDDLPFAGLLQGIDR
jgi:hypothetical protein